MREKILHTDTDTGAYIEMLEFREGTSDEWDNVHSYPVRQMRVCAGRAKCSITPHSWGYSGNGNGNRDVPGSRQCDLFSRLSPESARSLGGEIPGKVINMCELWTCITGEAKKKLFAKNEVEG